MSIFNLSYKELAIPYFKEVFEVIDQTMIAHQIAYYLKSNKLENRILRLLKHEPLAHKESKIARDWASKKGWEIQYALKILASLQKGMISNADYDPPTLP